ncbi:MAG: hypothetical protein U0L51_01035 [Olegusella sp.]|nr:hypothetical protein [Olegusella sp.]
MPVAVPKHRAAAEETAEPTPAVEPATESEEIDRLVPHVEETGDAEVDDEDEELSAEDTHAMPRIESAVPAGPDADGPAEEGERMPRTRVSLVAAIASIVIVGGFILLVAHPWDADLFSTRATEPADTSMAGYPGEVKSLSGQDSGSGAAVEERSGDEATYEQLSQIYQRLGEIEDELGQSQRDLEDVGVSGDQATRDAKKANQDALATEISNLISQTGQLDVSSGTYADDIENLQTLGNWLRNWSDALSEGWGRSTSSDNPSSDEDYILLPVTNAQDDSGKNSYQRLFDTNYEEWEPAAPKS